MAESRKKEGTLPIRDRPAAMLIVTTVWGTKRLALCPTRRVRKRIDWPNPAAIELGWDRSRHVRKNFTKSANSVRSAQDAVCFGSSSAPIADNRSLLSSGA
jgi:hypothetical protein